jgi:hypothetical protein
LKVAEAKAEADGEEEEEEEAIFSFADVQWLVVLLVVLVKPCFFVYCTTVLLYSSTNFPLTSPSFL